MVRLTEHEPLSDETVRRRLAEKELKPWQKKMWCIPKVDAEFVARMEDVLELYAEAPDPKRPVVCFDETPRQLIGEARVPVTAKPGKRARFDYEYVRNGTANVFMFVDVHRPWRHAKVTDRRAAPTSPSACATSSTATTPRPSASASFSTTSRRTRRGALPDLRARRGTPHPPPTRVSLHAQARELAQHGRDRDRRDGPPVPRPPHPDKKTLVSEIAAWQRRRNAEGARINWMFTVDRAREKLGRAYPRAAIGQAKAAGLNMSTRLWRSTRCRSRRRSGAQRASRQGSRAPQEGPRAARARRPRNAEDTYLERRLAGGPRAHPRAHRLCEWELGHFDVAGKSLVAALDAAPTNPKAQANGSFGHALLGNVTAAKDWARKALAADPTNMVARQVLIQQDHRDDTAIVAEHEAIVGRRSEIYFALGQRAGLASDPARAEMVPEGDRD